MNKRMGAHQRRFVTDCGSCATVSSWGSHWSGASNVEWLSSTIMNTAELAGLALAETPSHPEGKTLGAPPERRAFSLRRTSTQQSHYPQGLKTKFEMLCRSRDLFTGASGPETRVAGEDWITAQMRIDTVAEHIEASRRQDELSSMSGLRVGGPLRTAVAERMPEEITGGTRLFRMIDDMAGGAFLSGAAWQTWLAGGMDAFAKAIEMPSVMDYTMEGMCISYVAGSPALLPDGRQNDRIAHRSIGLLAVDPEFDPVAWNDVRHFDNQPNQARLRYMDVWREGGKIHAMFGFQDSAAFPGTDLRRLFHEYRGVAVIDPDSFVLEHVEMEFGSLPYPTCPAAAVTPQKLVGRSLREFRTTVIEVLKGTAGCTHLNDSLRTLQDVPALVSTLDECLETA